MSADARQLRAVAANAATFETAVEANSPVAGRALRDVRLPEGSIVLAVQRERDLLSPDGDLQLLAGDLLTLLARPEHTAELHALLGGVG